MNTAQALPKELESTTVVRFQDCDPYGHLNNARFIDYFLNAREDQLARDYDFHIFAHGAESGNGWVVSRTHIAYLSPARMTEVVRIRTRLIHLTESAILVEGVMLDADARRIKAVAWMEFTYVSLQTGRVRPHADELQAFLASVAVGDPHNPDGFNARTQELADAFRQQRRADRQAAAD